MEFFFFFLLYPWKLQTKKCSSYQFSLTLEISQIFVRSLGNSKAKNLDPANSTLFFGAIALSYPPRNRVRATAKLSAAFFHDESSITIGGYESAITPIFLGHPWNF